MCFFAVNQLPKIETIENVMKLSPMIVQGLWEVKNPLLQLPHIHEDNLKWFSSKKVSSHFHISRVCDNILLFKINECQTIDFKTTSLDAISV